MFNIQRNKLDSGEDVDVSVNDHYQCKADDKLMDVFTMA